MDFSPTTQQGLESLRKKPTATPIPSNWNGPYIEKEPMDPWGAAYMYTSPGKKRKDYDLYSKGKDSSDSSDDVTNWEEEG